MHALLRKARRDNAHNSKANDIALLLWTRRLGAFWAIMHACNIVS